MKSIVVTTPNGNIGRQVLHDLLTRGESLRVITRHPDRLADHVRHQVEVITGSTDNAELLTRALNEAEAMFWCIPASHTQAYVLMENFLWQAGAIANQGQFFYPLSGDYPMPMVATCDIARVATRLL